ncbi:MAG: DUF1015 domain-containing protein [Elusimicrobiota bacterium]|jgi:uncharacterized protein (DUF1015 family)
MVQIAPFKAVRYNADQISKSSDVIAPPYDVIREPEHKRLLKRHPNNIVRVELPAAAETQDRYAVAAEIWKRWQEKGVLTPDSEPAFYGYEQRFSAGGKKYVRRGFFAALFLETPGVGHVRPHERTFPKHKEDRLHLMRATHANISPIFGIFMDRKRKAQALLARRMRQKPTVSAKGDKGVKHRLWRWSDAEAIKILTGALRAEDVLIADGHHRYETAWNYAQERGGLPGAYSGQDAYRYVMTFLCPLEDHGLVIQPTHRLVRWQAPWDEWKKQIEQSFVIQPIAGLQKMISRLQSPREKTSLGLVFEGGKLFWLKARSRAVALPVVPLHEEILKDVPLEKISYLQDPKEVAQSVRNGQANAAFLLPPPDKDAFARLCKAGQRLPQKSTYFYPKLATGFVMRSLDGEA